MRKKIRTKSLGFGSEITTRSRTSSKNSKQRREIECELYQSSVQFRSRGLNEGVWFSINWLKKQTITIGTVEICLKRMKNGK